MNNDEMTDEDLRQQRIEEAANREGFVLKVKIKPEDFNERGFVKGDLVFSLIGHAGATLDEITMALHLQGLQYSLIEFIKAASESGRYGSWSLKKMIWKAMKHTFPEMMASSDGKALKKQIKHEVALAFERRNN